jgi:hypothetical protein
MTDKELLQQALDALEKISMGGSPNWADDVIPTIRTRLAQPELEPVAWYYAETPIECEKVALNSELDEKQKANCIPLYTAPPKKEWVGLTDEDVDYFVDAIYKGFDMKPRNEVEIAYFERLIKFVGAKLEDKNT